MGMEQICLIGHLALLKDLPDIPMLAILINCVSLAYKGLGTLVKLSFQNSKVCICVYTLQ